MHADSLSQVNYLASTSRSLVKELGNVDLECFISISSYHACSNSVVIENLDHEYFTPVTLPAVQAEI